MEILKNTTEGIYPLKRGEMNIISSGRSSGKSYYSLLASMQINKIKFMQLHSAIVDDELWYSLLAGDEAGSWLRTQDKSLVVEGSGFTHLLGTAFDVHEKIYAMMVLKFQ